MRPEAVRIDFAFGAADRLRTACEVVHKHYLAGRSMVVYCRDEALLERFSALLWAVQPTAFVPHVRVDDPLAAQTPILLANRLPASVPADGGQAAWLLNLDSACPPLASTFERVLEVVSQEPDDTSAARLRWTQYKSAGHDVRAHDLARRRNSLRE